ncbi:MAG TPA: rRNA methyltransferase [Elusimicrobia bacterium]|nr:rRNA methyltransferase [Elusimicrobiota bacterium]HBT61624.1 rRNA methyltransferase [Elusimicrobiota bacterium]
MPPALHVCQQGFEAFLAKEAGACREKGPGWVMSASAATDLCFAHFSLPQPLELEGESVNILAGRIADYFLETSRGELYEAVWPLCFEAAGVESLNQRCRGVLKAFQEKTSRMARVMRLAEEGRPALGSWRGLFVYLTDFKRAFAARQAWGGGQRRMSDDPRAPSRSYLKVEEAYLVLREAPRPGDSVADLGAAPGGWSFSAAQRGARVLAVDNGPLKGGALDNPLIEHCPQDAYKFAPERTMDWLFCDMIDDPRKVLELLRRWVRRGWCRKFIVNLKFGRHDPFLLLREAASSQGGISSRCSVLRPRHLFHDREEITLVGMLKEGQGRGHGR